MIVAGGKTVGRHVDSTQTEERVKCSVLIPVLDEERHIARTLDAMRRQRFSGGIEFLVVDGGSADRTREILSELAREDSRVRVLENPRKTTPSGLNIALAHARGQWVARMDAHTEYPDDYLELGVRRLARGDTRWVSGPPVARGYGPVSRAVSLALRTRLGRGGSRKWASERSYVNGEYELDAGVFGGVWERTTLLQYGGWDEAWWRNQDSEMAGRFLAHGERLICLPPMAAEYAPRDSLAGLWRQYFQYGEFRERTAVRHPHTMRRSHLLAPALVMNVATALGAPRRLRRLARRTLLVYGVALTGAGVQAMRDAERHRDAALVPVVLAIMHLAHGTGSIWAALRHGPPLSALARVVGLKSLALRLQPVPRPVLAPSLRDGQAEAA
jgi:succinoglycan biosynthesis protein ExoA